MPSTIASDVLRRLKQGPLGAWEHNALQIAPSTLKQAIANLRAEGHVITATMKPRPGSRMKMNSYELSA